jgi:hypothetical protein
MMCELAKLVTLNVERSPVGVPRRRAPSVSQESSITGNPCRRAISDAVPVGSIADEIGYENGPGPGRDHLLDAVDVDTVGIGLGIDERWHPTAPDDWCDIGREGQRAGDDLRAPRKIE